MGCTAGSRGRVGRLPFLPRGRHVAVCLGGGGALRVGGVPGGPPCPSLEDVGGGLLVFCRGGSLHRMSRQVFQHRPACVELVRT